jgi:predicted MPP superfamily phosphohydrolase
LKQLRAPVYFVDGNHDGYVNADSVKELLRQAGVHVLETEVVEDFGLQIVGLDYMKADDADANSMHAPVGDVTISSFCDTFRASDSLPVVLLHHNPCGGQYLEKAGVDLYLAGHTHGGQLFPLTLINNRVFQFNKGLYQFGKMQVYTSCGTGTFGPPMRLGTRSELTVLELIPRK